jgi:hypothetical protein
LLLSMLLLGTHAVAGVSAVVGNTVTGSYALVLGHAVPGAHALAGVSVVNFPYCCWRPDVLSLLAVPIPMTGKSSGPWIEAFSAWRKLAEKRGQSG